MASLTLRYSDQKLIKKTRTKHKKTENEHFFLISRHFTVILTVFLIFSCFFFFTNALDMHIFLFSVSRFVGFGVLFSNTRQLRF